MKESNPFWRPLQNSLAWANLKSVFVIFLISMVFPLAEAVVVNLYTGADKNAASSFLAVLFLLAGIHAILALGAIIEQAKSQCETILPKAFQLEENSEKLARELKRRETTNKLVRVAFDRLNLQSCAIEMNPAADAWCLGGFCKGLLPVLEPFLEQIDSTLGVRGHRFSLEVYFEAGSVPIDGCRNDCHNGLSQLFFYSHHIGSCVAVRMKSTRSPAKNGFETGKAFEQHIESNKQLFYDANTPSEEVYFRRYATCPINENCGDLAEGVLVLTSMQDEPFADDVLDTMHFWLQWYPVTWRHIVAVIKCTKSNSAAICR